MCRGLPVCMNAKDKIDTKYFGDKHIYKYNYMFEHIRDPSPIFRSGGNGRVFTIVLNIPE